MKNKSKQTKDLIEFLISIGLVVVVSLIGAIISGASGMFWFAVAGMIVAIVMLFQRKSFYVWVYAFFLVILLVDKFVGLENLSK